MEAPDSIQLLSANEQAQETQSINNMPYAEAKEHLLQKSQQWNFTFKKWFKESWAMVRSHLLESFGFSLIFLLLCLIPYVGAFIASIYGVGLWIIAFNRIRDPNSKMGFWDTFRGFSFTVPALSIFFFTCLAVAIGLLLLIIPGLYLLVALSLALPIYIEFHQVGLDIFDCLKISQKTVHYQFWSFAGTTLFFLVFVFAGICTIIGFFVALPMVYWFTAFMVHDILGSITSDAGKECVMCSV